MELWLRMIGKTLAIALIVVITALLGLIVWLESLPEETNLEEIAPTLLCVIGFEDGFEWVMSAIATLSICLHGFHSEGFFWAWLWLKTIHLCMFFGWELPA